MANVKISREGFVTNRDSGRELGSVSKVQWPVEVADPSSGGRMVIEETRWEARRPHETLTVSHLGFPAFTSRREAAESLTR